LIGTNSEKILKDFQKGFTSSKGLFEFRKMPFNRARGLGKEKIYESIGKYLSQHNILKCEPKSKTLALDELEMFFE